MEYAHRAYFVQNEQSKQTANSLKPDQAYGYHNSDIKLQSINAMAKNLTLVRGFSKCKTNEELVADLRALIDKNIIKAVIQPSSSLTLYFVVNNLAHSAFMMPDANKFEDARFRDFLQNELIETPTQFNLTESGNLNWWCRNEWEDVCRPLYPMMTSGDGNCLLHAASLSMWGLHDRSLVLRKALHASMQLLRDDNSCAIWRRWRWEQMCDNYQYELVYSEEEWQQEWHSLISLSSDKPRMSQADSNNNNNNNNNNNSTSNSGSMSSVNLANNSNQNGSTIYYESLEQFHVFLLAHILQRPVVVVADQVLRDLNGAPMSPIKFGGIYLPFECNVSTCHRYYETSALLSHYFLAYNFTMTKII